MVFAAFELLGRATGGRSLYAFWLAFWLLLFVGGVAGLLPCAGWTALLGVTGRLGLAVCCVPTALLEVMGRFELAAGCVPTGLLACAFCGVAGLDGGAILTPGCTCAASG